MLLHSKKGRLQLLPANSSAGSEKRQHLNRNKTINKRLKLDLEDGGDEGDGSYVYDGTNGRQPLRQRTNLPLPKRVPGIGLVLKSFTSLQFTGPRPVGYDRSMPLITAKLQARRNPAWHYEKIQQGCNPNAEGAIILYSPPEPEFDPNSLAAITASKKTTPGEENESPVLVHVVVDPLLGKVLRPHQVEGVRFLYECVTGNKREDCHGCIMADEMGLGKTLQCIALLWTLLKQSPVGGKPTADKAIVVCPSSLVRNWACELEKWLPNRIKSLACENKGTKKDTIREMQLFTSAKGRSIVCPVMIVSYETLRMYTYILKETEIGLLLCDEGHRLKNSGNQTYESLFSLNCKRRVILSGTPIQNDLSEYYALLTFANPSLFGSDSKFKKEYETPIVRGRDSMATKQEREKGEEALKQLMKLANQFIIRRTASLLTKYLPTKYEHVVFCGLSPLQEQVYKAFIESKAVKRLLNDDSGQQPLQSIMLLKKLCNHPSLCVSMPSGGGYSSRSARKVSRDTIDTPLDLSLFPEDFDFGGIEVIHSGKLLLLERMITKMRKETDDRIVLISNYTQTLDLFEKLCRAKQWGSLRLDGTLSIPKRQGVYARANLSIALVEKFNDPESSEFVFLLSSKAGGCGLNLVGANRLVLFDPDWNPANDGQALARVWRDGQKKICFIYRFIATGTIEEKIFQRQAHKNALSSCVVDEEEDVERHFSSEGLRQLFTLNSETACDTHDTFNCARCVDGEQKEGPNAGGTGATAADTSTWNHFSSKETDKIHDNVLRECGRDIVTYVFQNKSHSG